MPAQATGYSYDALGNLTEVKQGEQVRSFRYSSLSRLVSATNPELRQTHDPAAAATISYTYDHNGNLQTKTDPRRVAGGAHLVLTYDYDELNRVTRRTSNDEVTAKEKGRIGSTPTRPFSIPGRFVGQENVALGKRVQLEGV